MLLVLILMGLLWGGVEAKEPVREEQMTFLTYDTHRRDLQTEPAKLTHDLSWEFSAFTCVKDTQNMLIGWSAPSKSVVGWYVNRNGVWEQGGLLPRKRDKSEEWFGKSLSIDGKCAVVGAPQSLSGAGNVYVYAFGSEWAEVQQIKSPTSHKSFGYQVSLSSQWLAVSAPFGRNGPGVGRGTVYMYKATSSGTWELSQHLHPTYDAQSFGAGLSLKGTRLAVFGQADRVADDKHRDDNVFIYHLTGNAWELEATLAAPPEEYPNPLFDLSMFGHKLNWEDDALVVGAYSSTLWVPLLHVYTLQGSEWSLQRSVGYPFNSFHRFMWKIEVAESTRTLLSNPEANPLTNTAANPVEFVPPKKNLRANRFLVTNSACTYSLTAHSSGSGLGDGKTYIYLRGIDVFPSYGRGMNVATFDFTKLQNGATSTGVFDLFQNASASSKLVNFISASAAGTAFAFAVQDDATNAVTSSLRSAMVSNFGSTVFSTLGYTNSYVLIGVKGVSKPAVEVSSSSQSVTTSVCLDGGTITTISITTNATSRSPTQAPTHVPTRTATQPSTITPVTAAPTSVSTCTESLSVLSYGTVAGIGTSYIKLNGNSLLGTYNRGLDMAVLSLSGYKLVASKTFDTFGNGSASTAAVSFINAQSAGLLFVIVVQDEASNLLSNSLKYVVGTTFGATEFASLGYENSYVLIAIKGASSPLYEGLSATTTVQTQYCVESASGGGLTTAPSVAPSAPSPSAAPHPGASPAPSQTLVPTSAPTSSHLGVVAQQQSQPLVTNVATGVWLCVLVFGLLMLVPRQVESLETKNGASNADMDSHTYARPRTGRFMAPLARAESQLHNFIVEVIPKWMRGGDQLGTLPTFLLTTHSWLGLFFSKNSDLGGSRFVRHYGRMLETLTIMYTTACLFYILYPADGTCERQTSQSDCASVGSIQGHNSQCKWNADKCSTRDVASIQIVLLVSAYAMILAWPLLIMIGILLERILSHIPTHKIEHSLLSDGDQNFGVLLPEDLKPHTPTLAAVTNMGNKSLETEAKYVLALAAEAGYVHSYTYQELLQLISRARPQAKSLRNMIAHSNTDTNTDIYLMRAFILQHLDDVSRDVLTPVVIPTQLRHSPLPFWLFMCIAVFLVLYPCGLITFIIIFGVTVGSSSAMAWIISTILLCVLVFGLSEFLQMVFMRLYPSSLLGPTVRQVCKHIHAQLRQHITRTLGRERDLNTMWHTNAVHRVCAGLSHTHYTTTCVLYLLGDHTIERLPFPGKRVSFWLMCYLRALTKIPEAFRTPTQSMLVCVALCLGAVQLFQHLPSAVALVLLLSCSTCFTCVCLCAGSHGGVRGSGNSTRELMRRVFDNDSDTDNEHVSDSGVDEETKSYDEETPIHTSATSFPRRRVVVYTHVPLVRSSAPAPAPVAAQTQHVPMGQRTVRHVLSVMAAVRSGISTNRGAEVEGVSQTSENSLEEPTTRFGLGLGFRTRPPFFPASRGRNRQRSERRLRRGLLASEDTETTHTSETDPMEYKRTYVVEDECISEHELDQARKALPEERKLVATDDEKSEYLPSDESGLGLGLVSRSTMSQTNTHTYTQAESKGRDSSRSFKQELEFDDDEEPKDPNPNPRANPRRRTKSNPRTWIKSKHTHTRLPAEDDDDDLNLEDTHPYISTSSAWTLHLEPLSPQPEPDAQHFFHSNPNPNTNPIRVPSIWDDSSSEASSVHTTRDWNPASIDEMGPRARARKVRSFWRRTDSHAQDRRRLADEELFAQPYTHTHIHTVDSSDVHDTGTSEEEKVFW